jgi:hypothetical protein
MIRFYTLDGGQVFINMGSVKVMWITERDGFWEIDISWDDGDTADLYTCDKENADSIRNQLINYNQTPD